MASLVRFQTGVLMASKPNAGLFFLSLGNPAQLIKREHRGQKGDPHPEPEKIHSVDSTLRASMKCSRSSGENKIRRPILICGSFPASWR
jgi:hypothetical protein